MNKAKIGIRHEPFGGYMSPLFVLNSIKFFRKLISTPDPKHVHFSLRLSFDSLPKN